MRASRRARAGGTRGGRAAAEVGWTIGVFVSISLALWGPTARVSSPCPEGEEDEDEDDQEQQGQGGGRASIENMDVDAFMRGDFLDGEESASDVDDTEEGMADGDDQDDSGRPRGSSLGHILHLCTRIDVSCPVPQSRKAMMRLRRARMPWPR
jgi:hypothetical protein